MVHDSVLYTKKVTHHMHGQVKYIWLTECGYFGLSVVLWLFYSCLLFIFMSILKHKKENKNWDIHILLFAVDKDST